METIVLIKMYYIFHIGMIIYMIAFSTYIILINLAFNSRQLKLHDKILKKIDFNVNYTADWGKEDPKSVAAWGEEYNKLKRWKEHHKNDIKKS